MARHGLCAAVAVACAVVGVCACGAGGQPVPSPSPASTRSASTCPTLGELMDEYLADLEAGASEPDLDLSGCTFEEQEALLAEIERLQEHAGTNP